MPIVEGAQRPQALTRSDGANSGFSMTPDAMNIAFIHENPHVPTEVALLAARIMVPVFLTQLNPQVDQFALGQIEAIQWRSNDGAEINGLLVYPVGYRTGRRVPLVTYLHDGPDGAYIKSFNATLERRATALCRPWLRSLPPQFSRVIELRRALRPSQHAPDRLRRCHERHR